MVWLIITLTGALCALVITNLVWYALWKQTMDRVMLYESRQHEAIHAGEDEVESPPLFDVTVLLRGEYGEPIATVTHCNGVYDNSQLARLKNTLAAMLVKTGLDGPVSREYNLPFHAICDGEVSIRFVRLSDYLDAQRDSWCKPTFYATADALSDEERARIHAEMVRLHRGPR